MKTLKRALKINKARKGIADVKNPGDAILAELKTYSVAVEERLGHVQFALYVTNREISGWRQMEHATTTKLRKAQEQGGETRALEKLLVIAETTLARYEERQPELDSIVNSLRHTKKQIASSMRAITVDNNLRSVTNMFDIDAFEKLNFDPVIEGREIRTLLHSADALLELTGTNDPKFSHRAASAETRSKNTASTWEEFEDENELL